MRLVVDVNIVRSSGGKDAIHPHSIQCRNILSTIYEKNHKIVISTDLRHECVRNATPFSTQWYYLMKRNKLIEDVHDVRNEKLRIQILSCFFCVETKNRVEKDIHLIEAAIITDKKILSNNSKERKEFSNISSIITEFKKIIWVSTESYEQLLDWLEHGASCDSAAIDWFLNKGNR